MANSKRTARISTLKSSIKKFDGQAFTSLLYAQLLKTAGVDAVVTCHNHSIKVQNLFNEIFEGNFHNLIPTDVYAHYIKNSNFVQTGKDGRLSPRTRAHARS